MRVALCVALCALGLADDGPERAFNPAAQKDRELPVVRAGDRPLPAPEFDLSDLDGERVRLADVDAPVIILYFWTTFRQCEDDLVLLQSLHEQYAGRGVVILGLAYSSGDRDEVRRFTAERGVAFPILLCPRAVTRAYDVATFPTTFLLDETHRIRYWMYSNLVRDHWQQLIEELLAE